MPLTPAILSTIGSWPRKAAGEAALTFLEAEERGAPAKEAWEEARIAAYVAVHGLEPTPEQLRKMDWERDLRRRAKVAWEIYLDELQDFWADTGQAGTTLPMRTEIYTRMIRACFGKWARNKRPGESPDRQVEAQIRGAFLTARKRVIEGQDPGRLDPCYVFEIKRSKDWKRARQWANVWLSHVIFKEERA